MKSALAKQVAETLGRHQMLDRSAARQRVLVAVSGGPDSVALLWVLQELAVDLGFSLAIAHLDHGLRDREGNADRRFVEQLARRAQLDCLTDEVELSGRGENIEAQARHKRYEFLCHASQVMGCNRIATGHTLNDQAETVLMRILAGTGWKGLRGIMPVRGRVIRPLIESSRQDLWRFLLSGGYEWQQDMTNYDTTRARNRIRHLAMPFLAGMFNRRITRSLARLAQLARSDEMLLATMAAEAEKDLLTETAELRATRLTELPISLQRRVVRRWVNSHGARRPTAEHIDSILRLAASGGPARSASLGGATVTYELGLLAIAKEQTSTRPAVFSRTLAPGTEIELPEARLSLSMSLPCDPPQALVAADELCIADAAELPPVLTVRNRKPGDRLRPLGMTGSKEIKEVLREARVPRRLRSVTPIVCAGSEILWIPGVARSRLAAVTPSTRSVVIIRLQRQ